MRILIIDGYIDEPACFGVPPYISPYIRYIAGAIREKRIPEENIFYLTIDSIRTNPKNNESIIKNSDLIILIAGITVPGKYLRSTPISLEEINAIIHISTGKIVIGGPIRLGFGHEGGKQALNIATEDDAYYCKQDIEAFVYDLIADDKILNPFKINERLRSTAEIGRWSQKGAFIIKHHPDFPYLMCELETYRGCGRKKHCSFCTEPFYGKPDFRQVKDVVREVESLYSYGARYFRIGRQPDILSYQAIDTGDELTIPNPQIIKSLYTGIRKVAPNMRVLHMDNVNPGTIAAFPEKAEEILKTIVKYHTSGDVAAMGMESADPIVIKKNDLKIFPEEMFEAVKLLNKIGAQRGLNGMPELLPGINFVHGLIGESKKTFELNYIFLKELLNANLLIRRINIRQVMTFPGTAIFGNNHAAQKYKKNFLKYKEKVRKDIDLPMLRKLVPIGTVLKDIMLEVNDSNITFGRQLGSYPLLVGVPDSLSIGNIVDVTVTGHGFRSITAVPYPLNVNNASINLIQAIPGINKDRAIQIFHQRPFTDQVDFSNKINLKPHSLKYIII